MIQQKFKAADNVLILSHVNPDGDTLGAMCATYGVLKEEGKKVDMLIQGQKSEAYSFLPFIKDALTFENFEEKKYDCVICVDIAAEERIIKSAENAFHKADIRLAFDHHITNKGFCEENLIKPEASSTCEVLFEFFEQNGYKISKEVAECLYVGILTDTGGFKYENTTAKTLECAAKSVEKGADPCKIYRLCYENQPEEMVLLQAFCLNKANFIEGGKIAYTTVTLEDLKKFNAKSEHTEGICEALRKIKTVELAFVLKEVNENTTRVSMRSKKTDVSEICQKFGGGGHKYASGCTINKPYNIALNKVLEAVI